MSLLAKKEEKMTSSYFDRIAAARALELNEMKKNIFNNTLGFEQKRQNFVYKLASKDSNIEEIKRYDLNIVKQLRGDVVQ